MADFAPEAATVVVTPTPPSPSPPPPTPPHQSVPAESLGGTTETNKDTSENSSATPATEVVSVVVSTDVKSPDDLSEMEQLHFSESSNETPDEEAPTKSSPAGDDGEESEDVRNVLAQVDRLLLADIDDVDADATSTKAAPTETLSSFVADTNTSDGEKILAAELKSITDADELPAAAAKPTTPPVLPADHSSDDALSCVSDTELQLSGDEPDTNVVDAATAVPVSQPSVDALSLVSDTELITDDDLDTDKPKLTSVATLDTDLSNVSDTELSDESSAHAIASEEKKSPEHNADEHEIVERNCDTNLADVTEMTDATTVADSDDTTTDKCKGDVSLEAASEPTTQSESMLAEAVVENVKETIATDATESAAVDSNDITPGNCPDGNVIDPQESGQKIVEMDATKATDDNTMADEIIDEPLEPLEPLVVVPDIDVSKSTTDKSLTKANSPEPTTKAEVNLIEQDNGDIEMDQQVANSENTALATDLPTSVTQEAVEIPTDVEVPASASASPADFTDDVDMPETSTDTAVEKVLHSEETRLDKAADAKSTVADNVNVVPSDVVSEVVRSESDDTFVSQSTAANAEEVADELNRSTDADNDDEFMDASDVVLSDTDVEAKSKPPNAEEGGIEAQQTFDEVAEITDDESFAECASPNSAEPKKVVDLNDTEVEEVDSDVPAVEASESVVVIDDDSKLSVDEPITADKSPADSLKPATIQLDSDSSDAIIVKTSATAGETDANEVVSEKLSDNDASDEIARENTDDSATTTPVATDKSEAAPDANDEHETVDTDIRELSNDLFGSSSGDAAVKSVVESFTDENSAETGDIPPVPAPEEASETTTGDTTTGTSDIPSESMPKESSETTTETSDIPSESTPKESSEMTAAEIVGTSEISSVDAENPVDIAGASANAVTNVLAVEDDASDCISVPDDSDSDAAAAVDASAATVPETLDSVASDTEAKPSEPAANAGDTDTDKESAAVVQAVVKSAPSDSSVIVLDDDDEDVVTGGESVKEAPISAAAAAAVQETVVDNESSKSLTDTSTDTSNSSVSAADAGESAAGSTEQTSDKTDKVDSVEPSEALTPDAMTVPRKSVGGIAKHKSSGDLDEPQVKRQCVDPASNEEPMQSDSDDHAIDATSEAAAAAGSDDDVIVVDCSAIHANGLKRTAVQLDKSTEPTAPEPETKKTKRDIADEVADEPPTEKPATETKPPADEAATLATIEPLRLEFMRKFSKHFTKMTRADLEELVLQKVCEAFVDKSQLARLRQQLDAADELNASFRQRLDQNSKMLRDLEMVHDRVVKDMRTHNNGIVQPVKITRAVGLQVNLSGRRDPNALAMAAGAMTTRQQANAVASASVATSPIKSAAMPPPAVYATNGSTASPQQHQQSKIVPVNSKSPSPSPAPSVPATVTVVPPPKRRGLSVVSNAKLGLPPSVPSPTKQSPLPPVFQSHVSNVNSNALVVQHALQTPQPQQLSAQQQAANKRALSNATVLQATRLLQQQQQQQQQQVQRLAPKQHVTLVRAKNTSPPSALAPNAAPSTSTSTSMNVIQRVPPVILKMLPGGGSRIVPVANGYAAGTSSQQQQQQRPSPNAGYSIAVAASSAGPATKTTTTVYSTRQSLPANVKVVPFAAQPTVAQSTSGTIDLTDEDAPSNVKLPYKIEKIPPSNRRRTTMAVPSSSAAAPSDQKTTTFVTKTTPMANGGVSQTGGTAGTTVVRNLGPAWAKKALPAPTAGASSSTNATAAAKSRVPIASGGGHMSKVGAGGLPSNGSGAALPVINTSAVATAAQPARHPAPPPLPGRVNSQAGWGRAPPRPSVRINSIDSGIVVSWVMDDLTKDHAEIVTYQIYAYQETDASPTVDTWRAVGDVKALVLPMAVTLTQFQEGQRYYFAVRAVDHYGRFGFFSFPRSW